MMKKFGSSKSRRDYPNRPKGGQPLEMVDTLDSEMGRRAEIRSVATYDVDEEKQRLSFRSPRSIWDYLTTDIDTRHATALLTMYCFLSGFTCVLKNLAFLFSLPADLLASVPSCMQRLGDVHGDLHLDWFPDRQHRPGAFVRPHSQYSP